MKADGKLHQDGYFTWSKRDTAHLMDAKLPAEFVLLANVQSAIDAAVEAEREACKGNLCEDFCIKAIRARGNKTRDTIFSPCRTYRYTLWREWIGGEGYAMFVGLNPSTADETQDDPTIRRCISFAKAWGYAGMCMTNLFAYRATDPEDMKAVDDPVGPENDANLMDVARGAGVIVAAWGVHGTHKGRNSAVLAILPALHCMALTKDGHPGHPLYLRKTLTPVPFWHG